MAIAVDPLQLERAFSAFRRNAFRLEALPSYSVDEEAEEFSRFLAGEFLPTTDPADRLWERTVLENCSAGKSMRRVHILPPRLTPYLRYEIEWGYVYSARAGEEIYLLTAEATQSSRGCSRDDFWLFDDEILFFLRYDTRGRFCGVELERNMAAVARHCQLRDSLVAHSTSLRRYLASIRASE